MVYNIHFRSNTLVEKYEPPYPPSYGLNSTTTCSSRSNGFGIK